MRFWASPLGRAKATVESRARVAERSLKENILPRLVCSADRASFGVEETRTLVDA